MPEVCIRYAVDTASPTFTTVRLKLAEQLIGRLPAILVAALAGVMDIDENQMTIDIQPYHSHAHNAASLCVAVQLSRGENGEVYAARKKVVRNLYASVVAWLQEPEQSGDISPNCMLKGVDVKLVFADACGINTNPDGEVNSAWG